MPVPSPKTIPRGQWQLSTQPIYSSWTPRWTAMTNQVIHWPGGYSWKLAGLTGSEFHQEMVRLLRGEQAYYLKNRGYSLGYNDLSGPDDVGGFSTIYEARGATYRCAANGDATTNLQGNALQFKLRPNEGLTQTQIRTARYWIRAQRQYAALQGNTFTGWKIYGHRDVRQTSCPSDPVYHQIRAGLLDPINFDPGYGFYGLLPFNSSKPVMTAQTAATETGRQLTRYLQAALKFHAKQPLTVDGVYDQDVANAVWNLQKFFNIKDVFPGVCGPPTWSVVDYLARMNA